MRALVVIPTYNEAESVVEVLDRVLAADPRVDVLVVDDGSPDGTAKLVLDRATDEPRVHLMERSGKQGLGPPTGPGSTWGLERGYDALVEMDADLSHPGPAAGPAGRAGQRRPGHRVAVRARGRTVNWSRLRGRSRAAATPMCGSPLACPCTTARPATGLPAGGPGGAGVDLVRSSGYCFQVEMVHKTWQEGFVVTEVPITFTERASGVSKMSKQIVAEALLRVAQWALTGAGAEAQPPSPQRRREGRP